MLLETREIDFMDLTADEIKAQPIGLEVPGIVHLAIHDNPGTDMFMCVSIWGKYPQQAFKEGGTGAELLFFDYDGNYKGGVKVNHNPQACAYDPETNSLYVANMGDEDIKTILLNLQHI